MCIHVSAIVEKLHYGQPIRHNGFEDFKRKKWGVQNFRMPATVAKFATTAAAVNMALFGSVGEWRLRCLLVV